MLQMEQFFLGDATPYTTGRLDEIMKCSLR